jgi:hypothetical protein
VNELLEVNFSIFPFIPFLTIPKDMKDENWRTITDHRKLRIQSLVRSAQLLEHDETDPDRYERALEILSLTEKETTQLLEDIQTAFMIHDEKGNLLKGSTSESRAQQPENEEHAASRRSLQARLRECNVLLHRIIFLQVGMSCFLFSSSYSDLCCCARETFIIPWGKRILRPKTQHIRLQKSSDRLSFEVCIDRSRPA